MFKWLKHKQEKPQKMAEELWYVDQVDVFATDKHPVNLRFHFHESNTGKKIFREYNFTWSTAKDINRRMNHLLSGLENIPGINWDLGDD